MPLFRLVNSDYWCCSDHLQTSWSVFLSTSSACTAVCRVCTVFSQFYVCVEGLQLSANQH